MDDPPSAPWLRRQDGGRRAPWRERLRDKAPWLHRLLTSDAPRYHWARTLVSIALVLVVGASLLWGLTGQGMGDAPVVVVESGSMMHCDDRLGANLHGSACASSSFGRIGTIDPGDLIFVRKVRGADDVTTVADAGRDRYGMPGDVIIFDKGTGTPIIHRAMFWIDIHGDGTYSVPSLGIHGSSDLGDPRVKDPQRFGLTAACRLFDESPLRLQRAASGWVTKGDNNQCWDQSGGAHALTGEPVRPDQLLGKARGELPWLGLVKLGVFDIFQGTNNFRDAPGDLKWFMWGSLAVLIGGPYAVEWVLRRRGGHDDGD